MLVLAVSKYPGRTDRAVTGTEYVVALTCWLVLIFLVVPPTSVHSSQGVIQGGGGRPLNPPS